MSELKAIFKIGALTVEASSTDELTSSQRIQGNQATLVIGGAEQKWVSISETGDIKFRRAHWGKVEMTQNGPIQSYLFTDTQKGWNMTLIISGGNTNSVNEVSISGEQAILEKPEE